MTSPRTIAEAFHIASTGRPGPVLVDVTKDALQAKVDFQWPTELSLPGYRPVTRPHPKQVREAARLIAAAEKPVLYVGGGVIRAKAHAELSELAELTRPPGGHHADGPRRAARTRTTCTSACPGCTARSPRSAPCSAPTCSSASAPASTTG